MGYQLGVLCALIVVATSVNTWAALVETGDGLTVGLNDSSGAVDGIALGDTSLPMLADSLGGLSVRVGRPVAPSNLVLMNFDGEEQGWFSAASANWNSGTSYVSRFADGGVGNTPHLLLGDGTTNGVGLATASPAGVMAGTVRIQWHASVSSTDTLMILCVRIFDSNGQDITQSTAAPVGWGWSSTSMAHFVAGIRCEAVNTWEQFTYTYVVPSGAASMQVSLRHWNGGDHWVHIDDLSVDYRGGMTWGPQQSVTGPVSWDGTAWVQSAQVAGESLQIQTRMMPTADHLRIDIDLQDTAQPMSDVPVLLYWTLPVDTAGWRWWDDLDTSREIGQEPLSQRITVQNHGISLYPFSGITNGPAGLTLGVPASEAVVQRFEASSAFGMRSVWELGLSPITSHIGAGHAAVSCVVFRHDGNWGFRSATARYQTIFASDFVKRTPREGAWMYPIHPTQIPNPLDFGFAWHETWPVDDTERQACNAFGIGIYYYLEPWLAWQGVSSDPNKPPYEDRVATLEGWAAGEGSLAKWVASGGVGDSGHLLLGDGVNTGAGMATSGNFVVAADQTLRIEWQARTSNIETLQILCMRVFDAAGADITAATPSPAGWAYSGGSAAHYIAGIACEATDAWQAFSYVYRVPANAAWARLSLRHWTGGDHFVHIDDLLVTDISNGSVVLSLGFNSADNSWVTAQNADWENSIGPKWLRVSREVAATAVLNSSPADADGHLFIDSNAYLWHEWSPGTWNQAWPLNPDPDIPGENTFKIYHENWVHLELNRNEGVYIDSVETGGAVASWENRRRDHLAVTDTPLTFAWGDGKVSQLASQAHTEFLKPISQEVRGLGKYMMLNLFPRGMRYHSRYADIMGSEVTVLVEADSTSRLRRTLAGKRIVTNLLQYGWDLPTYATYEQMEEFILGQLFWGFFPSVSSTGGPMIGGGPDRYFLHPELYERDRPLYIKYMPVIAQVNGAGWEPVTHARADVVADVERFGDFARGPVLLTIRGRDRAALSAVVTLDMGLCHLPTLKAPVQVWDVLTGQAVTATRSCDGLCMSVPVSLDAGRVAVYRFELSPSVAADFDGDYDVDQDDFAHLQMCLTGPGTPVTEEACTDAKLDGDSDVDWQDIEAFIRCFNGPEQAAACAEH